MRRKKSTVKVTLRFRALDAGKESLYLDFYPPILNIETGKPSRREYLGMVVFPLKNRQGELLKDKNGKNRYNLTDMETIRLAEIIRNNRQNVLDKANIYTDTEAEILKAKERSQGDFIAYFKQLANDKKQSNYDSWNSVFKHLIAYTQKTDKRDFIRFCDVTLQWCEGFKDYLLKAKSNRSDKMQIATNTAAMYFIKFKVALKSAYRYGYLPKNINADLKSIKEVETQRDFLTLDELKKLVVTPCTNDVLKRSALLSALTGLRHSDIIKMKWGEIIDTEEKYTLRYTIQKTGSYHELPIGEEAMQLCGERQEPEKLVFAGLKYSAYENKALAQWIGLAGITRNITFHCFRHTFATLQLANATQITTIQKMLAHKNLETTLVYAKTLEEAKREAADKIKIFNKNIDI